MKLFWFILIFVTGLANLDAQEQTKINAKLDIKETNGPYVLTVDINSNLPEGSTVKAEVYYAKKYFVPESLRKPDEPEYNIEPIPLGETKEATISHGSSTIAAGKYKRRPYVGEYRVEITFDPDEQLESVIKQLPPNTKKITQTARLDFGKPEELETQKKNTRKEIYAVFEQVKKLYDELAGKVKEQTKEDKFHPDEWTRWRESWQKELVKIKDDNEGRLEERIYYVETVGKHAIQYLESELRKIAETYEQKAKVSNNMKSLAAEFVSFTQDFNYSFADYLNRLGFGMIPDKPAVKAIIAEIERNLGLINNIYEDASTKPEAAKKEWSEKAPLYQDKLQRQLFGLARETSDYIFATYTTPFTQDFIKYLEGANRRIQGQETSQEKEATRLLFTRLKTTLREIKETLEIE